MKCRIGWEKEGKVSVKNKLFEGNKCNEKIVIQKCYRNDHFHVTKYLMINGTWPRIKSIQRLPVFEP